MARAILIVKLLFLFSLAHSTTAIGTVPLTNPSFESPPTNLETNTSSQFVLLNTISNVIPGWLFRGTVYYVTAGKSVSLPGNGHGLQLGPNGMISQALISDFSDNYVLTFTLAPSSPSCANEATAVNVSGPSLSKVFSYKKSVGKEVWQTYAYVLWRNDVLTAGSINIQFQSVAARSGSNTACWPIIDDLLLTGINYPRYEGNGFSNSGFELGPSFLENSSQGILLEAETNLNVSDPVQSALQSWVVLGTVKYIDSKHYVVPQGLRAVELLSSNLLYGNLSGIAYNAVFYRKGQYTLDFIMGDAGDSCVGDFMVVVQVGTQKWNFAMRSNGLGSSKKYSLKFNATNPLLDVVPISFVTSYNETRTIDNRMLCGPVIDGMFLNRTGRLDSSVLNSSGLRSTGLHNGLVLIFVSVVTFLFFA